MVHIPASPTTKRDACGDENLSSVGQPQARGRAGRHAAVQIRMTDDRGTEGLGDGRAHRFRDVRPRGPRCERHAASYAARRYVVTV
jgi:hypothetical protein